MKAFLVLLLVTYALAGPHPRPSASKLGHRHPSPRIIGGHDAEVGQFPYQISYQWGFLGVDQHVCGGSILSPTWILTAGHCVTEVPAFGEFKAVVGITNLNDQNPERQTVNVVEKIVHPDFTGGVGPNDVALLHLEKPIEFNDLVQPVKLPEVADVNGNATLSGWGAVNDVVIPIMPEHLQTVDLPVLTNEECNEAINKLLEDGEESPYSDVSNLCTGPLAGGFSACSGDSGGPLAQDGTIVGIVSWGWSPCGSEGAPSVFTRVGSFVDFIKSHVDDLPQ